MFVRLAAIRGLGGFLSVPEAEHALKAAAEDTDPAVRNAAALGLRPPTRPFAASHAAAAPAAPAASGLTGLISEMPLETLFQSIAATSRTGTLRVIVAEGIGLAHFLKGAVVAIEFGDARDVAALRRLLALRAGAFSFRNGDIPSERRLSLTIQALLLEAMRVDGPSVPGAA